MNNYLPTDYQNFIALSRYARWKEDEQRRETWSETVERYFDYMENHLDENYNYILSDKLRAELEEAVNLAITREKWVNSLQVQADMIRQE